MARKQLEKCGIELIEIGGELHPIAWGIIRCHVRKEGGPSFEQRENGLTWMREGTYCLAMHKCPEGGHHFSDNVWAAERVVDLVPYPGGASSFLRARSSSGERP